MDFVTLITATGFLVMAVSMSTRDGSPRSMLVGLSLVVCGMLLRLFGGGGFFATVIPLFTDAGLSLIVASAWLLFRRSHAKPQPFFILGLLSLVTAGALYLGAGALHLLKQKRKSTVLIELGPDDSIREVRRILRDHDARAMRAFPTVSLDVDEDLAQVFIVVVPERNADALMSTLASDEENVDFVERNIAVSVYPPIESHAGTVATTHYLENDPRVGEQWALEAVRGHAAHALLSELNPVRKARVAILDTGVEGDHEDLQDVFGTAPNVGDVHGHGTHCAGIAGGATNNGLGIASLNWNGAYIELSAYRALGDNGTGTIEQIAQAIIDASQADADVISMSLGSFADFPPQVVSSAVAFAHRSGVIVAASAGNSNRDASNHFPSNIDGVIAVAAVGTDLSKAPFSNTVGSLGRPIAAPGVDILSSVPGSDYAQKSGTSMATPMVTGLLGIMRALNPDITADEAYSILHESGRSVEDTPRVGRLIDAEAAILATIDRGS